MYILSYRLSAVLILPLYEAQKNKSNVLVIIACLRKGKGTEAHLP
jgi:hypothetical protein